jgi:hypothetical protein
MGPKATSQDRVRNLVTKPKPQHIPIVKMQQMHTKIQPLQGDGATQNWSCLETPQRSKVHNLADCQQDTDKMRKPLKALMTRN